jgi:anti-sigma B factor antagonist
MTTDLTFSAGRRSDGTPVLAVTGEIDMSNAGQFGTALAGALPERGKLAVDLTGVGYLDTSGLALLFRHAQRIEVTVGDMLATVVTISGLAELTTVTRATA